MIYKVISQQKLNVWLTVTPHKSNWGREGVCKGPKYDHRIFEQPLTQMVSFDGQFLSREGEYQDIEFRAISYDIIKMLYKKFFSMFQLQ